MKQHAIEQMFVSEYSLNYMAVVSNASDRVHLRVSRLDCECLL